MTVYLDTSVVVSRLLRQPNALRDWGAWEEAFTSVLTQVEFLRTTDRLRLEGYLDDEQRVLLHQDFGKIWEATRRVPLNLGILDQAASAFPTVLGTLDALHLASALAVRADVPQLTLLTHDLQLGRAACAMGLPVEGIEKG
jgi:predicted nucleic acid-binding protein